MHFNQLIYRCLFYLKQGKRYKVINHGGINIAIMRRKDRKLVFNIPKAQFIAAKIILKTAKVTVK